MPSIISLYLIKIKLVAFAVAPANIFINALANTNFVPFKCANYLENLVLMKNNIETERVTAPIYPSARSLVVYLLEAFLLP